MKVTVTYYSYDSNKTEDVLECKNQIIDDFIKEWNASEIPDEGEILDEDDDDVIIISRDKHYICDEYNNVYKKTDKYFVGDRINVYQIPPNGNEYYIDDYDAVLDPRNSDMYIKFELRKKAERELLFKPYQGFYHETYLQLADREFTRRRLKNLEEIKKMNSTDKKLLLGLHGITRTPPLSGLVHQFPTIKDMIAGPSNHPTIDITQQFKKKPSKKQKIEYKKPKDNPEQEAICVIV